MCKNKETVSKTVQPPKPVMCAAMNMDREAYLAAFEDTAYTVLNAFIQDDCIGVQLLYDQECSNDRIELLWDYRMMKSLPPQAPFRLKIVRGKPCQESKTSMRKHWFWFSLNELSSPAYGGRVVIRINGYDKSLEYNYAQE